MNKTVENDPVIPVSFTALISEDSLFYAEASCILVFIGTIGMLANIGNVYLIYLSNTVQCSYGYICVSHSVAQALNAFIACGYPIILTLLNPKLATSSLTYAIGNVAMGICVLTSHMCLYKALNRFIAITKPFMYRKLFSRRSVAYCITLVWIVCTLHCCVGFIDGCYFTFDPEYMYWYFVDTFCGHFLGRYIDLLYSCVIMVIVIILDFITLTLLISFHNRQSTRNFNARDVVFFAQSCGTTLLQVFMLISFHVLSKLSAEKWPNFFTTTFAWGTCSAVDGVVNSIFSFKLLKNQLYQQNATRITRVNCSVQNLSSVRSQHHK